MGYREENDKKIDAAFLRLTQMKDQFILNALTRAMEKALDTALDIHETLGLNLHLTVGDDYGWMICHNGVPVGERIYSAAENYGTAKAQLESLMWMTTDVGWDAVLMAGMQAAHYHSETEEDILRTTIDELADQMAGIFRDSWTEIG